MDAKMSVLFAFLASMAVVSCAPAQSGENSKEDPEIVIVPLEHRPPVGLFPGIRHPEFGNQPIVDTGAWDGPSYFTPFSDVLQGFEAMMLRLRQQLNQVLSSLPGRNTTDSDGPEIHLPQFGDIDLNKGNTTSVTKVIDGHKVVINETEYKQEGDNGQSFFRVRIVDIHPEDDVATTEPNAEEIPVVSTTKDTEPLEASVENEIPRVNENEVGKENDPAKLESA